MRDRAMLHKSKIETFLRWAEGHGYSVEQTQGIYEALRLRAPSGEVLIGHKRDRTDHVTTTGALTGLVKRWLRAPH